MKKLVLVMGLLLVVTACDGQRTKMPISFHEMNNAQRAATPGYDPNRDYMSSNYADVGYVVGRAEIVGVPVDLGCGPVEMTAQSTGCSQLSCIDARKKAEMALFNNVQPKACQPFVKMTDQSCQKVNCPE